MMKNSPTTMNEDVMLEIMSYCPATEMAKFRLLNKECNKRSYELSFINRHLHRTNSFFGYIIHYRDGWLKNRSRFVSGVDQEDKTQINLAFLPPSANNAVIEACDTHHGILLCVNDKYRRRPDFIVCKPATKQFRIIPNPKTRYYTTSAGLVVLSLNPFRYKIIRVSALKTRPWKKGFYSNNSNYCCEVFDSDLFAWKRLNDLELPELFPEKDKPVWAYGCLHWLTRENNVIRFCMRTETWSTFPVPDDFTFDNHLILVSYEGKLGVIHSRTGEGSNLWVLEKSFEKSWVNVKDAKITILEENHVQPLWFPSKDVVSMASSNKLGLYNMSRNNYQYLLANEDVLPCSSKARECMIPFYSNYDRVGLNKRANYEEEMGLWRGNIKKKEKKYFVIHLFCVVIILLFTSVFFFMFPTL